jgi:hypothetical protein
VGSPPDRSLSVNLHRPILSAIAALSLAGCSGPQVRSVGNGGGAPAYELRGPSLAALEAEAYRLCGRGYDVLRSSQNVTRPEGEDSAGAQFMLDAGAWLSGMPGNQAQVTVICRS